MDAVKKAARPFVRDCLNRRMNRRGRFWHSQTVARILIRLGREVDSEINAIRAERDAYRATLLDIAAVKHPGQQRTPHQEMARECVQKWETGK